MAHENIVNPYLNQPVKRFETDVILGGRYFHIKHRGVVYHVKHNGDTETILLASNHRWREGYLMVIISPKEIDAKEMHKLINDYVNRLIWCQRCLNEWDGAVSFRIDLRGNKFERVVCAYCDPTVDFAVGFFDNMERKEVTTS